MQPHLACILVLMLYDLFSGLDFRLLKNLHYFYLFYLLLCILKFYEFCECICECMHIYAVESMEVRRELKFKPKLYFICIGFCMYGVWASCVSLVPMKAISWSCTDSRESPCEWWESSQGLLQEQGLNF